MKRPGFSVQSPASNTCVQSSGISICLLQLGTMKHIFNYSYHFWNKISSSYLKLPLGFTRNKWYRLILAKVLHIWKFIKNALHHGRSPYSFPNFLEFLKNLSAGLRYVSGCVFSLWYSIFTSTFIFLQTHWVRSSEIWPKIKLISFIKRSWMISMDCLLLTMFFCTLVNVLLKFILRFLRTRQKLKSKILIITISQEMSH